MDPLQVEAALKVSTIDGRRFIQESSLNIWRNPFAPLPPPKSVVKQQQKEARRAREIKAQSGSTTTLTSKVEDGMQALNITRNSEPGGAEPQPTSRTISHFVMNLPGSALEFLDAYNGCYKALLDEPDFPGKDEIPMPLVHTHCFTKMEEGEAAERDICEVCLRDTSRVQNLC